MSVLLFVLIWKLVDQSEHNFVQVSYIVCHSGSSMWDSEVSRPGFDSPHGSHCVIEAGAMCKLTVAVTSGQLVH